MANLDLRKFKKDIEKAVQVEAAKALREIPNKDLQKIGDAAVHEMKRMIMVGQSPIKEVGRFQAYKWVGFKNKVNKFSKRIGRVSKKKARAMRKEVAAEVRNKYPYSVQGEYPNKKERPVNLVLSGNFLRALAARVFDKEIVIAYWEADEDLKEQGHREGTNGQPKRPTLPQGNEEFAPAVYRRIVNTVIEVVKKRFGT